MGRADRAHRQAPGRGQHRARREVREAPRRVPLGARGVEARGHPPRVRDPSELDRRRRDVARGSRGRARSRGRGAHPGRVRLTRLGGKDPRLPGCTREGDPVPGHLPRDARGDLGVRAARGRAGRRQLDGDGSRDAVPGDRPPPGAEGDRGSGRHDAARRAGGRAVRGHPDSRHLRRPGDRARAAPAPVRGEQRLPRPAGQGRPRHLGHVPGRAARRDHRAAGPPVVRREPVPSGVQVAPHAAGSALQRVRRRRRGPRGRTHRSGHSGRDERVAPSA